MKISGGGFIEDGGRGSDAVIAQRAAIEGSTDIRDQPRTGNQRFR